MAYPENDLTRFWERPLNPKVLKLILTIQETDEPG